MQHTNAKKLFIVYFKFILLGIVYFYFLNLAN